MSVNYPTIIPNSIIRLFRHSILSAHGGDLPRYRGNTCQAWAILNGEKKIGLCIHKMEGNELDCGDIIVRDYMSIDYNTKVTKVWNWRHQQIPRLMIHAIDQLSTDPNYILERQSRNPHDILRCYLRIPEDGCIN